MFEATLKLTFDYKTSEAAHELLEKIIRSKIEKIKVIDYGL